MSELPELTEEDLNNLLNENFEVPVGDLQWDGLTDLYEATEEMWVGLEPDKQAVLDRIVTHYLNEIRSAGVDTTNEHDMQVFARGVNTLFAAMYHMLVESQCPDFDHVWMHFMQAAHRASLVIIHARKGLSG